MKFHSYFWPAFLFAYVMCLYATPLHAQSESATGATLIQPNDKLTIDVYKNPDLSRQVTVQPDGLISISLVQSIQAAGLTPAQLKAELEKRLKEYLEVPTVTVIIDAIQSYRVYVTGKVQKPGVIVSERPLTVLQALSLAGGFQEYNKKDQITIVRTISPQVGRGQQDIKYPFDYDKVIDGSKQAQNIFLLSGDVVNVP
jgi:polysaccharide biosynthesis/export protein